MNNRLSKKRAISTVLTTVIILVSSVILGAGVVLYGTSLFQGGTQTESFNVVDVKVWVHDTDTVGVAWGAASVRNTGDKVISVDRLTLRGTDIPYGNWYADTTLTSAEYQQSLNHTGWVNADPGTTGPALIKTGTCVASVLYLCIDQDSNGAGTAVISADASTGPVSLTPGSTAAIYFKIGNGTYSTLDSGIQSSVNIYAGNVGAPYSVIVTGKQ